MWLSWFQDTSFTCRGHLSLTAGDLPSWSQKGLGPSDEYLLSTGQHQLGKSHCLGKSWTVLALKPWLHLPCLQALFMTSLLGLQQSL